MKRFSFALFFQDTQVTPVFYFFVKAIALLNSSAVKVFFDIIKTCLAV